MSTTIVSEMRACGKGETMKRNLLALSVVAVMVCVLALAAFAQTGIKKKRPLPADYGRVVMNNYSEKAGLAPVVFDHWFHRSKFTCRLCHVDVSFGMKAGTTGVKAADNMKGYYCGACHRKGRLHNPPPGRPRRGSGPHWRRRCRLASGG